MPHVLYMVVVYHAFEFNASCKASLSIQQVHCLQTSFITMHCSPFIRNIKIKRHSVLQWASGYTNPRLKWKLISDWQLLQARLALMRHTSCAQLHKEACSAHDMVVSASCAHSCCICSKAMPLLHMYMWSASRMWLCTAVCNVVVTPPVIIVDWAAAMIYFALL